MYLFPLDFGEVSSVGWQMVETDRNTHNLDHSKLEGLLFLQYSEKERARKVTVYDSMGQTSQSSTRKTELPR